MALLCGVSVVAGKRESWVPLPDEEMTFTDVAARVVVATSLGVVMVALFVAGVVLGLAL